MNTLNYKGYLGRFAFAEEDDVFFGEVVGINDVITFQGRSIDELRADFQRAVDSYLDFCRQMGRPAQRPYSGQFRVRLDADLHRRIAQAAAASGKSLNAWVAETLEKAAHSSPAI